MSTFKNIIHKRRARLRHLFPWLFSAVLGCLTNRCINVKTARVTQTITPLDTLTCTPVTRPCMPKNTQILTRLDVVLPAEQNRWWRRQIDGETPHLVLLSRNPLHKYRGPIWTEDRYTSGKPMRARVLISARGDFLIEMEPRGGGGRKNTTGRGSGSMLLTESVIRLEVTTQELWALFRDLNEEKTMKLEADKAVYGLRKQQSMECLLDPVRRMELCR